MTDADPIATARQRMVVDQLQKRNITAPRVLSAMSKVPRERFMPCENPEDAYADQAWSIGWGQTISQPLIVALMTQALQLEGGERVLEIGTGSGYQTAILAELAREVMSIERHAELSTRAGQLLEDLAYTNVQLKVADGTLGWPGSAPYNAILVSAAAAQLPSPLWDQLIDGGRLVIPLGSTEHQVLYKFQKTQVKSEPITLCACRFVPLIGTHAWPDS